MRRTPPPPPPRARRASPLAAFAAAVPLALAALDAPAQGLEVVDDEPHGAGHTPLTGQRWEAQYGGGGGTGTVPRPGPGSPGHTPGDPQACDHVGDCAPVVVDPHPAPPHCYEDGPSEHCHVPPPPTCGGGDGGNCGRCSCCNSASASNSQWGCD